MKTAPPIPVPKQINTASSYSLNAPYFFSHNPAHLPSFDSFIGAEKYLCNFYTIGKS